MARIDYNASTKEMGLAEIKEANRFMWGVKGMLIPIGYSTKDVHGVLQGYFKRLWCNCDPSQFDGFEEAWEQGKKIRLEKWET